MYSYIVFIALIIFFGFAMYLTLISLSAHNKIGDKISDIRKKIKGEEENE